MTRHLQDRETDPVSVIKINATHEGQYSERERENRCCDGMLTIEILLYANLVNPREQLVMITSNRRNSEIEIADQQGCV